MIIFGIDPGVSGAISVLENKKVIEIYDMPTMIAGKKNKRQVNGSQVTTIILNGFGHRLITQAKIPTTTSNEVTTPGSKVI